MSKKDNKKLIELLEIQKKRLDIAIEWEKNKKIVLPETSLIIKNIIELDKKINNTEDDMF